LIKSVSSQRRRKPGRKSGRVEPPGTVSDHALAEPSEDGLQEPSFARTDARYWRQQLLLRRYRFPATGESERDFAAFIDHASMGYFFPLGTPEVDDAAAKACQIYSLAVKQGWAAACRQFSRELTVGFEWCTNPVLWTYTTIHTLIGGKTEPESDYASSHPNSQRVLVVESDAGVLRALCWCIDQQSGFVGVPCEAVAAFAEALDAHQPRMILVNRNLAGRIGFRAAGTVSPIRPGMPALTYSVYVDCDQMFVSTPGGAGGYLAKRVEPDRLLEPILRVASRSELMTEDFLLRAKYYFQELLQLRSSHDTPALARLTRRERELMELLSKGWVDKEIAHAMGISVWTVHGHIKNIFERLEVRSRTEAVIRYLEK
jgi:DNA-binding NarL/FixJ family response regulator